MIEELQRQGASPAAAFREIAHGDDATGAMQKVEKKSALAPLLERLKIKR